MSGFKIHATLEPAYGRVYADIESAFKDWQAGKDFRMSGTSTYTSVRDRDHFASVALVVGNHTYDITLVGTSN